MKNHKIHSPAHEVIFPSDVLIPYSDLQFVFVLFLVLLVPVEVKTLPPFGVHGAVDGLGSE